MRVQETKARRAISLGKVPTGGLFDRLVSDLQTAAIYSPAGFYQAGHAAGGDIASTALGKPTLRRTTRVGKAIVKGVKQDIQHPLRHPGFTALDIAGIAAPVAGAGARVAEAGRAAAAGESVARALVKGPKRGRITYRKGDLTVETPASRNVLRRQVQKRRAAYINKRPDHPALVRKMGKALERQTRIEGDVARAPSHLLEAQGRKLRRSGMQKALRVVAEGQPIEERIRFHREQGAKATSKIERRDHAKEIRSLRAAQKYVENVRIKTHPLRGPEFVPRIKADAPVLGKVYGHLRSADAQSKAILRDTGQMPAAGLEARTHAPGRVIGGARMETQREATKARGVPARPARKAHLREYPTAPREIQRLGEVKLPERSRTITRARTQHEAETHLAGMDKDYEKMVKQVAAGVEGRPGDYADVTRRRNMQAKKRRTRGLPPLPKVSEEMRIRAENQLVKMSEGKTPYAKKLKAFLYERENLRNALNERALPVEGGPSSLGTVAETKQLPAERRLGVVTETIPGKPRRVSMSEQRAQRGVKATPRLAGNEEFRRGQAYVPYFKGEAKGGTGGMARSGPVVGRVQNIVSRNKRFTGQGLLKGQVPENTTGLVARQTLRAVRYLQSDTFRQRVLGAASDTRQSEHDVLINDRTLKNATLPAEAKALVGKERYTLDELSGHATAFEEFRRKLFPMGKPNDYAALGPEERLAAQEGGKVKGYKWIDERLLRGVNQPASYTSSRLGRGAVGVVDAINNAQRLAILYLKPAYAIPNIAGNAFLNLVQQGFAAPRNLKAAAYLSNKVGDAATATLDSIMGEGVTRAIAGEGGAGRRIVDFAAGKWSTVVDLPFRRAAFIHEARNLGYGSPERLRALLTDPAHHADLVEASQRATSSIIDYGNLGEFERNVVRRVVFFYPWVKGSTQYGGHFIAEHPTQAAIVAHLAQTGKEKAGLGPVPSYLAGSFNVGGKLVNPQAAGIFGTGAQVVQAGQGLIEGHPTQAAQLSQFATPAVGLGLNLATRQNSLGIPYPPSAGLKEIAQDTLVNSLPQAALLRREQALRSGADQSQRLFPVKNWWDVTGPFTVGGVGGRSYNPEKMHALAKKETRVNMSPEQRVRADYKTFGNDLRAAIGKNPNTKLTPELRGRLVLRYERATARQKAAGGHKLDSRTALLADVDVIHRHGWIDDNTATKWKTTLATTAKGNLPEVSRYLTEHYFDPDSVLSESIKYLRDNGHPNLKVPALP